MVSLVPITFFIIIFLVFQTSPVAVSWRGSFLSASLIWGLLLTAITEFLSLFRLIGFWEVLGFWVLSVALASIYLIRVNGSVKELNMRLCLAGISRFELLLLSGMALIIIIVGLIGWISPPNSWDSMTYHMSRVVHWIQNRSVANYPTHILRQLHQNPWAEFAILHFQILDGSDRFANLVQWFSMIGTTLGVSLLAKQLGASSRGQIFAAVISVTLPMGILQGSSTQTDYVVSFWLVCLTHFAILLKEHGKPLYSLAVGISLGLAMLTKGTAYIYAFPFMTWIGLSLIKSRHVKGLQLIALIVLSAVVINLGHYSRNYDLYGSPLGPGEEGDGLKYSNDIFTIASVTSNAMRNIGLHIGTPFDRVNALLEDKIYKVHRVLGFDPNDPRTTWAGTKFHIIRLSNHEDEAGNPLHLVLIMVSIPTLVLRQRNQKDIIYYFACLAGAFILFSLYLKWQPWNSRLHLPLFLLWSSLLGLSLSQIRIYRIVNLSIVIFLLGALPYVLKNQSRPIIDQESIMVTSRTELYFKNYPSLAGPYKRSARFVLKSQCSEIGLVLGGDDGEYPFWVLLGKNGNRIVLFEHVNVTNVSQVKLNEYPYNTFTPCAVIVVGENHPNELYMGDAAYMRKMLSNPVSVFLRK